MRKSIYVILALLLLCVVFTSVETKAGDNAFNQYVTSKSGNTFVLKDKKLGPVTIGKPIKNLPKSVSGLYDNYQYKKVEYEDEMDGPWTDEFYIFTLKGKNVFRATIDEGVVYNIKLLEGSTNIVKTPEGFYVGYSARELFKKKRLQWATDFMDVYAESSGYIFTVNPNDVTRDVPEKLEHFKVTAKIRSIIYR